MSGAAPPEGPENGRSQRGAAREQLVRLRAAGARLRARPAREVLELLGDLLDRWREPESPALRALVAELAEVAGFHPTTLARGLEIGLAPWTRSALLALVARDLGGVAALEGGGRRCASGFATTSLVAAGALPLPTALQMLLPLLLRSPVLVRPSAADPVTPAWVARELAELDPTLGDCVGVLPVPKEDEAAIDELLAADCVVVTGSDETVERLRARVRGGRRFVGYAHRLSVTVLGPLAPGERVAAVRGTALDAALFDQRGCLSTTAVYVADPDPAAAPAVAEALARELEALARELPPGVPSLEAAARIRAARGEAEMRAAGGAPVRVLGPADGSFTVVLEAGARYRGTPLHRFLRVHPLRDPAGLSAALGELGPHLAGIALAGFGTARPEVARKLARLGASRICPPGELQSPPLSWHHDGASPLLPLCRIADLEVD